MLLVDSVDSVDDEDSVVLAEVLVMFFVKVLGSKEYVTLVPAIVSERCSKVERDIGVLPVGNAGIDVTEPIVPVPTVGSGTVPLPLDGYGPDDEVDDQIG